MNKKVYLSNLEWVKTHDNMGGVKAEIVFKDTMTYDEYKELLDKTYYVLTDTNLENNIDKAIEYNQEIVDNYLEEDNCEYCDGRYNVAKKNLNILKGDIK